jgi:hypothetical protein
MVTNLKTFQLCPVYAFCRVCNEARLFPRMLDSIEDVFFYGIIIYENCTDGTDMIAEKFCLSHRGFVCVRYPYAVLPPFHEQYRHRPPREIRLDTFYSTALSYIPQGAWFMKVDADMVFNATILRSIFRTSFLRLRAIHHIPRIEIHCEDSRAYVDRRIPTRNPGDQLLLPNQGISYVMDGARYEKMIIRNRLPRFRYSIPLGVTFHFPCEKSWRRCHLDMKYAILFTRAFPKIRSSWPDQICESLGKEL